MAPAIRSQRMCKREKKQEFISSLPFFLMAQSYKIILKRNRCWAIKKRKEREIIPDTLRRSPVQWLAAGVRSEQQWAVTRCPEFWPARTRISLCGADTLSKTKVCRLHKWKGQQVPLIFFLLTLGLSLSSFSLSFLSDQAQCNKEKEEGTWTCPHIIGACPDFFVFLSCRALAPICGQVTISFPLRGHFFVRVPDQPSVATSWSNASSPELQRNGKRNWCVSTSLCNPDQHECCCCAVISDQSGLITKIWCSRTTLIFIR